MFKEKSGLNLKKIFILGAGGFAKEVFMLVKDINSITPTYEFGGFVDINPERNKLNIAGADFEILDQKIFLDNYGSKEDSICLAIGVGNPVVLEKISKTFNKFIFPNLIHPKSHLDSELNILGKGNIITAGCVFTVDIKVGSFNIFNLNTTLGHDSVIADGNVINPGCNLSGGINIGSFNLIGTGATILQNLKIGSHSILGAGAVLVSDIESKKMALGVPAKVIKDL